MVAPFENHVSPTTEQSTHTSDYLGGEIQYGGASAGIYYCNPDGTTNISRILAAAKAEKARQEMVRAHRTSYCVGRAVYCISAGVSAANYYYEKVRECVSAPVNCAGRMVERIARHRNKLMLVSAVAIPLFIRLGSLCLSGTACGLQK